MQEPDDTEESPFRQPTPAEQRMGLGCVIFAIVLLFLAILVGLFFVF